MHWKPMPYAVLLSLAVCPLWAAGLIDDPGVEDADAWALPAGGLWSIADDDGHSGASSLRYEATEEAAAPAVEVEIAAAANTEYVVSAWFKSDGVLQPAVQVVAPDAEGQVVTQIVGRGAAGQWAPVSGRFNSGGATTLRLRVLGDARQAKGGRAPAGTGAIDDIQVWPAAEAPADLAVEGGLMRRAPGENIALGKPYTLSPTPGYGYSRDEGDATQLTDGVYSVGYFWVQKTTVGWTGAGLADITIDLGQVEPICGVSYNTAAGVADVGWPAAIFMMVSDDGQAWYDAGELRSLSAENGVPPLEGYAVHRFWTGEMATHGRYMRLLVAPGTSYTFCDEVEVYRGPEDLLAADRGPALGDAKAAARSKVISSAIGTTVLDEARRLRDELDASNLPAADKQRLEESLAALRDTAGIVAATDDSFRAIAPFNDAHARVMAVRAALWRSSGLPALSVWQTEPYYPLQIHDTPPAGATAPVLDVAMMRNEVRPATLNLTNASDGPMEVAVALTGVPQAPCPDWADLQVVTWTGKRGGGTVGSALLPAQKTDRGWSVQVPAGTTQQLWLNVDSRRLEAGQFSGTMLLTPAGADASEVPLGIDVADVELPDELTLSLGGWDYTDGPHRGVTNDNVDAVVAFLTEYHVDCPWATTGVMPFGTHGADGSMTEPPGTASMDRWVSRWPTARYYCVFNAFSSPVPDTEAGRRKIAEWITFWVEHLKSLDIKAEQLCLLLADEPHNQEQNDLIVSYSKIIREAQPEVQLFTDPTWRDPRQMTPELLEQSTILCPNRPMWMANPEAFTEVFLAQQAEGRKLAFYSCSGPVRDLDPYSYHRLQAWDCYRYNMIMGHFWAFGDNGGGSAWNEYAAGGLCYSPQFLGPDGCTTSKHMEAIREGLYDFEYLVTLKKAIEEAEAAGGDRALLDRARTLLEEGPVRVVEAEGNQLIGWMTDKDRTEAEIVRREIIAMVRELRQ